jgi:putative spermidine/putrescine transport system permease protein
LSAADGLAPPQPAATRPRQARFKGWSLVPASLPVLVVVALFLVPLALMASLSLRPNDDGLIGEGWTVENYVEAATDSFTLRALLRTLALAAGVGLSVTLLSLPVAYFLARTESRWRGALLALSLAPELAGVVLRTYGWLVILDRDGAINQALLGLGLIAAPLPLRHSFGGVLVGMTHVLLPFGILSLYTLFRNIDPNLERAAAILGAGKLSVLFRILLPLALPGAISAFFLSFTLTASAYATPALLGGMNFQVLATMIYGQLLDFVNWPMASVLANVLLVIVLCFAVLGTRMEAGIRARLHG